MTGQLQDKVAIVTGASRGIGKAIALLFASEGAKVVVAARTELPGQHPLPGSIRETVAEITAAGGQALPVRCDISKPEEIQQLVEATHEAFGPVDIVVNNAALNYFIPMAEFPLRRWNKMIEVDLTGPFLLTQAVLPDMFSAGRGHIVNITSGAARHPEGPPYEVSQITENPYGALKAALNRLTTGLAQELYDKNIAVNAVGPSALVLTEGARFLGVTGEGLQQEPPEYMARAALFLATCDPKRHTGMVTYSQDLLRQQGLL